MCTYCDTSIYLSCLYSTFCIGCLYHLYINIVPIDREEMIDSVRVLWSLIWPVIRLFICHASTVLFQGVRLSKQIEENNNHVRILRCKCKPSTASQSCGVLVVFVFTSFVCNVQKLSNNNAEVIVSFSI